MTTPLEQMQAYQAQLVAAGIRTVIDGRDVNPPAVQLRAPTLHYRFGRGCTGADWEARLLLPDNGQEQALKAGLPLLQQITDALGGIVVTATPRDYQLPDGALVVGFSLTWSTH